MTSTLLGFYIRRTWLQPPIGKTLVSQTYMIYPSRKEAEEALVIGECGGHLDPRFNYDVAEVWARGGEP